MGNKEYDKYKATDVEWIGKVPAHWDVIKIKYLSPVRRGASPRPIDDPKFFDDEGEYAWVRIADVSASDKYLVNTTQRMSEHGSRLSVRLNPGEMFLSIAGTVGKPCITKIKCCIHDGFVYFPNLKEEIREFLYYIFETGLPYRGLGKLGTQLNLNTQTVGDILIPIPENDEINKIIRFIRANDNFINELLLSTRKQIETLQQYRQSLITETVTRGLNSNAKMRKTNVEWLAEMPEHWSIKKLKYMFSIKKIIANDKNPTVLSLTQKGLKIKDLESNEGQHAADYSKYQEVKLKDFVMNSMDLLTGFVDCSEFEGVTSPDYRVFVQRDSSQCHQYFLYYFQICYWNKIFYGHGQGVSNFGRWRLQTDVFKEFPVPVPPISEQYAIAEFLAQKVNEIEKVILEINNMVDQLQKYRQSLIYEAVTGKIDVRKFIESDMEVRL